MNMVFWIRLGSWISRIIPLGEVPGGVGSVLGASPEAPGRVPEGSWEGPGRVPGWSWKDSGPRQAKVRDGVLNARPFLAEKYPQETPKRSPRGPKLAPKVRKNGSETASSRRHN